MFAGEVDIGMCEAVALDGDYEADQAGLISARPGKSGGGKHTLYLPGPWRGEALRDSASSLWHRLRLNSGGFLEYNKGDGESVQQ